MPSFDVVSEPDMHEVQNAFDQALREVRQRYDFQGTDAALEQLDDSGFKAAANSEERTKAIASVLQDKFVKRKISLKYIDVEEAQPSGGKMWNLSIKLKKGLDSPNAKKIVQMIKEKKSLKVTPSIQGDLVRVTGKKKDNLQEVMGFLKESDLPVALSFKNFRD